MKTKTIKRKLEKKLNSPSDNLQLIPTISPRDHYMYNLFYKGKKIATPQITRSSKEFGKKLISLMARQLGISSEQLREVERCSFWAKDFIKHSRKLQN